MREADARELFNSTDVLAYLVIAIAFLRKLFRIIFLRNELLIPRGSVYSFLMRFTREGFILRRMSFLSTYNSTGQFFIGLDQSLPESLMGIR